MRMRLLIDRLLRGLLARIMTRIEVSTITKMSKFSSLSTRFDCILALSGNYLSIWIFVKENI
jgi:hypothetical protein